MKLRDFIFTLLEFEKQVGDVEVDAIVYHYKYYPNAELTLSEEDAFEKLRKSGAVQLNMNQDG